MVKSLVLPYWPLANSRELKRQAWRFRPGRRAGRLPWRRLASGRGSWKTPAQAVPAGIL